MKAIDMFRVLGAANDVVLRGSGISLGGHGRWYVRMVWHRGEWCGNPRRYEGMIDQPSTVVEVEADEPLAAGSHLPRRATPALPLQEHVPPPFASSSSYSSYPFSSYFHAAGVLVGARRAGRRREEDYEQGDQEAQGWCRWWPRWLASHRNPNHHNTHLLVLLPKDPASLAEFRLSSAQGEIFSFNFQREFLPSKSLSEPVCDFGG
jgi:hypothetical protein